MLSRQKLNRGSRIDIFTIGFEIAAGSAAVTESLPSWERMLRPTAGLHREDTEDELAGLSLADADSNTIEKRLRQLEERSAELM